jgi:hypothetical protein
MSNARQIPKSLLVPGVACLLLILGACGVLFASVGGFVGSATVGTVTNVVLALLTGTYALLTLLLVVETRWAREEENEPIIVFVGDELGVRLLNIGSGLAREVSLQFSLIDEEGSVESGFGIERHRFVEPGEQRFVENATIAEFADETSETSGYDGFVVSGTTVNRFGDVSNFHRELDSTTLGTPRGDTELGEIRSVLEDLHGEVEELSETVRLLSDGGRTGNDTVDGQRADEAK